MILFLDIDGVLNSSTLLTKMNDAFAQHIGSYSDPFSEKSPTLQGMHVLLPVEVDGHKHPGMVIDRNVLEQLVALLRIHSVKVVVSSTWRFTAEVEIFKILGPLGYDVLHVDWRTDKSTTITTRGKEIEKWLKRHPETKSYLILDDGTDFEYYQKIRNWMHVDHDYGLTIEDLKEIHIYFSRKVPGVFV